MKPKTINTEGLDKIFSFGSKAVIIVPIVILILSLLFFTKGGSSSGRRFNPLISPAATLMPTSKIKIDFNGPLVCRYKNNNQEYDLFVKNRKVTLKIKAAGQTKKYDLTSYLPLVEGMINGSSANLDSLVSQYLGKKVDVEALYKTCKKEDF